MMEDRKSLLEIFGVKESYKLPDKILEYLLSDQAANKITEVKNEGYTEIRDIFQEEQGDRKNLKQDFTPDCICQIIAEIMKEGDNIDMCSGTGALSKWTNKTRGIKINEYEYSERTIPFALLDACVNGMMGTISRADCLRSEVFESYTLEKQEEISIPRQTSQKNPDQYQNVIMNPPYSMKFPDTDDYEIYGWKIPKSKADFGFILRGVQHLKEDGRQIAVLPHGILFRGAQEGKIRRWLIENHMISAVIGVPDKLFLNTSIPVFLLVIEHNSKDVLFIDASKEFIKKAAQNDMEEKHIEKVVNTFLNRKEVEKYSYIASYKEIEENDFNLNIPRYVDSFEEEPLPDVRQILKNLKQIDEEETKIKADLYSMLNDLTGSKEDMKVVEMHKNILKPKKPAKEVIGQLSFEGLL